MGSPMARMAGVAAIGLSFASLLLCFGFIPLLRSKLVDIRSELQLDYDEWNVEQNAIWRELILEREGAPTPKRYSRQADKQCRTLYLLSLV